MGKEIKKSKYQTNLSIYDMLMIMLIAGLFILGILWIRLEMKAFEYRIKYIDEQRR